MAQTHQKIIELKNKVGTSPIHRSFAIHQPDAIRAKSPMNDEDPRLLKQYFCVWGKKDDYGCMPMKGCFKKSIKERGPNSNVAQKITVFNAHDSKRVLCVPSVLKEDDIGLYAEYRPDEGVQHCDELVIQVRSGSINGGSYGFNYIWDSMIWNEKKQYIEMHECHLLEVSPVVYGSQTETFAVRNSHGVFEDQYLLEETENLLKHVPGDKRLEMRNIIDRHITLAKLSKEPLDLKEKALAIRKPKHVGLNMKKLAKLIDAEL